MFFFFFFFKMFFLFIDLTALISNPTSLMFYIDCFLETTASKQPAVAPFAQLRLPSQQLVGLVGISHFQPEVFCQNNRSQCQLWTRFLKNLGFLNLGFNLLNFCRQQFCRLLCQAKHSVQAAVDHTLGAVAWIVGSWDILHLLTRMFRGSSCLRLWRHVYGAPEGNKLDISSQHTCFNACITFFKQTPWRIDKSRLWSVLRQALWTWWWTPCWSSPFCIFFSKHELLPGKAFKW